MKAAKDANSCHIGAHLSCGRARGCRSGCQSDAHASGRLDLCLCCNSRRRRKRHLACLVGAPLGPRHSGGDVCLLGLELPAVGLLRVGIGARGDDGFQRQALVEVVVGDGNAARLFKGPDKGGGPRERRTVGVGERGPTESGT